MLNFKRSTSVIGRPFVITSNRLNSTATAATTTVEGPTVTCSTSISPTVAANHPKSSSPMLSFGSDTLQNPDFSSAADLSRSSGNLTAVSLNNTDISTGAKKKKKKKKPSADVKDDYSSIMLNTEVSADATEYTKHAGRDSRDASNTCRTHSDLDVASTKQSKKSRGSRAVARTHRSEDVDEYKGGGSWSLDQLVEFIDNGRKPRTASSVNICEAEDQMVMTRESSSKSGKISRDERGCKPHDLIQGRKDHVIESDSGFGDWSPIGRPVCDLGKGPPRSPSSLTTEESEKSYTPPSTTGLESPDGGVFLELHVEDLIRSLSTASNELASDGSSDVSSENAVHKGNSSGKEDELSELSRLEVPVSKTEIQSKRSQETSLRQLSAVNNGDKMSSYSDLSDSLSSSSHHNLLSTFGAEDYSSYLDVGGNELDDSLGCGIQEVEFVVVRQKRRKARQDQSDKSSESGTRTDDRHFREENANDNGNMRYRDHIKSSRVYSNPRGPRFTAINPRQHNANHGTHHRQFSSINNSISNNSTLPGGSTFDPSFRRSGGIQREVTDIGCAMPQVAGNQVMVRSVQTSTRDDEENIYFELNGDSLNDIMYERQVTVGLSSPDSIDAAIVVHDEEANDTIRGTRLCSTVQVGTQSCDFADRMNETSSDIVFYCEASPISSSSAVIDHEPLINLRLHEVDYEIHDHCDKKTRLSGSRTVHASCTHHCDSMTSPSSSSGFHLPNAQAYISKGFQEVITKMKRDPLSVIIYQSDLSVISSC